MKSVLHAKNDKTILGGPARCRHIITNIIVCDRYPIAIVQCLICYIENSYVLYFRGCDLYDFKMSYLLSGF